MYIKIYPSELSKNYLKNKITMQILCNYLVFANVYIHLKEGVLKLLGYPGTGTKNSRHKCQYLRWLTFISLLCPSTWVIGQWGLIVNRMRRTDTV